MYNKTTPHTGLEFGSGDVTLSRKNKLMETLFPLMLISVGICGLILLLNS
ncbi:MAG: hypothetical protein RLY31_78 [Bacteroidota bacterium]|jgi:hypothetical protein